MTEWRTERTGPISGSLTSSTALSFLLVLTYLGLGQVAFSMEVGDFNITSQTFFPAGAALFFVILFGPRVSAGIFSGEFVLSYAAGLPALAATMPALVSSAAIILGGHLFWRWRISPHLNRPREMALLVVLCALVVQPIVTSGGILAHYLFNDLPAQLILISSANWSIANLLGQILVVPFALAWLSRESDAHDKAEIRRGLLIASFYLVPLAFFVLRDWGEIEQLYRVLLLSAFFLPLIGVAAGSRIKTVSFIALLLALPGILLIHVAPSGSALFPEPVRFFSANLILFAGVVSALLLSSLREELVLRTRQLHEAVAAREQLFAVIGHDLRGPIGNLRNILDLMISGDLGKEEFQEVQHDLRKGVGEAHEALESLIEWGTGSFTPTRRPVNLHQCASEATDLLALTANRKQIEIGNDIPNQAWVEADGYQLESVFRNLISNALKFTRPGGQITLSASQGNGLWCIAFNDTGIGMTRAQTDRLFRPGNEYRSTPGTANERGLGLGLQLCHEFIQANRGTITVSSEQPVGTTFYVNLPAIDAP